MYRCVGGRVVVVCVCGVSKWHLDGEVRVWGGTTLMITPLITLMITHSHQ